LNQPDVSLAAMPHSGLLTVEQFVAQREEFADGGRWTELLAGRLFTLQPPTIEHGAAVLNLSKALAEFAQRESAGYACFELGFIVGRNPDTLRFPAVSFFGDGPLFAEADKVVTEVRPSLVAEVASTNDRRRNMKQRVSGWLEWGVPLVWVLDPLAKEVHVSGRDRSGRQFTSHQTLYGGSVLTGFRIGIGDLFKEPGWAK
jgi:Uma2 family endonuclease